MMPRELQKSGDHFFYPLLWNSLTRVLSFRNFQRYFTNLPNGESVLDYGAAHQPLKPMLNMKFSNYIAADWPPSNELHGVLPDISINNDKLSVSSDAFDCVVLTEVLEHLYEPKKALQEIHRILKPGGALIGTVPFAIGEHEAPYDYHRYTSFCLQRMFEDTGFRVIELEYVGDGLGVAIVGFSRAFAVFAKILRKLKLTYLATLFTLIIRIPEFMYYGALRIGIDPRRIGVYKNYPIGFSFHAIKK